MIASASTMKSGGCTVRFPCRVACPTPYSQRTSGFGQGMSLFEATFRAAATNAAAISSIAHPGKPLSVSSWVTEAGEGSLVAGSCWLAVMPGAIGFDAGAVACDASTAAAGSGATGDAEVGAPVSTAVVLGGNLPPACGWVAVGCVDEG